MLYKATKLKNNPNYALDQLVADYNSQDEAITGLIEDFCYHLAVIVNNLIALYDPQMIFFNAPLIDKLPEILKNIQMKLGFMPLVPPLVMSKDVTYATLLGGASQAIHRVLHMEGARLIFHH